jgi:DNA-binding CsgD family transcriptional regulator
MQESNGSPLEQAIMGRQTVHEILESTAEPAYCVDGLGQITGWNRPVERLLGHAREAVLGQPCHRVLRGIDVFGNQYCEPDCPLLMMARQRSPIRQFQMDVWHRDNAPLRVLCFAFRIPGEKPGTFSLLHLLRRADQPLPQSINRDEDAYPRLTDRELTVLRLLANGRTTRGMATEISISPATVRKHIQNIFKKLGVHTRLGAVSAAFERGIL